MKNSKKLQHRSNFMNTLYGIIRGFFPIILIGFAIFNVRAGTAAQSVNYEIEEGTFFYSMKWDRQEVIPEGTLILYYGYNYEPRVAQVLYTPGTVETYGTVENGIPKNKTIVVGNNETAITWEEDGERCLTIIQLDRIWGKVYVPFD